MDAVKYLEERQRMCDSCDCGNCEISHTINGTGLVCRKFESAEAKKAVAIVEKWSVEHPRKTRKDTLLEKYPDAQTRPDGIPEVCAAHLGLVAACEGQTMSDCVECWMHEDDKK